MKAVLYDAKGAKKSELDTPQLFTQIVREDIVAKCYEAEKFEFIQPYSAYAEAGKRHSASGTIRHGRHRWKAQYGRGISRVPRKTMWRRGTQFYWIGAEVSNTRGGRRAHPPKGANSLRKINKKEYGIALRSALTATTQKSYVLKRYITLKELPVQLPAVVESLPRKIKEINTTLKIIFPSMEQVIFKERSVRAGRGKIRGRKYKSNAGLLLIAGRNESIINADIDVKSFTDLHIADLYPLGRLTLFTKKAWEELQHGA